MELSINGTFLRVFGSDKVVEFSKEISKFMISDCDTKMRILTHRMHECVVHGR